MTVAALPITELYFSPTVDRGVSQEAKILQELFSLRQNSPRSVTIEEPKRAAQEALNAAITENDEVEVEPSTIDYAEQFLRLVPMDMSIPEIEVDSDGEIMLEWDQDRRCVFSVSVGRDGTLSFAGLFGHNPIHGTEDLRETLPDIIADCFKRLVAPAGL
ncbi:MAG: hypothetical protein ACREQ7_07375 [Candidatus Binatia bacterium]